MYTVTKVIAIKVYVTVLSKEFKYFWQLDLKLFSRKLKEIFHTFLNCLSHCFCTHYKTFLIPLFFFFFKL